MGRMQADVGWWHKIMRLRHPPASKGGLIGLDDEGPYTGVRQLIMLAKLLRTILRNYVGEFLTGLENLELGALSGKIQLANTALKHDHINQILKKNNIPLSLKYSSISSLSIDIPYSQMLKEPVVEIKVTGVYIVLQLEKIKSIDKKIEDEKLALVKSYADRYVRKIAEQSNKKDQSESGFFAKLLLRILRNLNIKVEDISIRIQCSNNDHEPSRPPSENYEKKRKETNHKYFRPEKQFALGLCVKCFSSHSDDEHKDKSENADIEKKPTRKLISLQEISVYWEEQMRFNLFQLNQVQKAAALKSIISREEERLLSINGQIVMKMNSDGLDYSFEMELRQLNAEMKYGQLREMVKVYVQIKNTLESGKVKKMEQLSEQQQLALKQKYEERFSEYFLSNGKTVPEGLTQVLKLVSKRFLLEWTREWVISHQKKELIEAMKAKKNKKGWLSYVITQAEVDVTPQEIAQIERTINEIIQSEKAIKKKAYQVNLMIHELKIGVDHPELKQSVRLMFSEIHLQWGEDSLRKKVVLEVGDIDLSYQNFKTKQSVAILKCEREPSNFLHLQLEQDQLRKCIILEVASINLNHEVQVLLLLNQLVKLKHQEQLGSDVQIRKVELMNRSATTNLEEALRKTYEIDVKVGRIMMKVQVNDHSYILVSLQGIEVATRSQKLHVGAINSFRISYDIDTKRQQMTTPILQDLTITFEITNHIKNIQTTIPALTMLICEKDLFQIQQSLLHQVHIFKVQKAEQKQQLLQEDCYMRGELKLLNIFKTWKLYEATLTDNGIFFYDKVEVSSTEQSTIPKHVNYLPLKDGTVTVISQNQFRIEADDVNQLLECENQALESWVDSINKVIFECSSKMKMYSLIDGQPSQEESPSIKYHTEVSFQFGVIFIRFNESQEKQLLALRCRNLNFMLSENELTFKREIKLEEITLRNCSENVDTSLLDIVTNQKLERNHPIRVVLKGKKKPHPQYKGQLEMQLQAQYLSLNYHPEFFHELIKKVAWRHEVPGYTTQMRDQKILQLTRRVITSRRYRQIANKLLYCHNITDNGSYSDYMSLESFKKISPCFVLLSMKIAVSQLQLNLINGANNIPMFNSQIEGINVQINKGAQFMFFKLTAADFNLSDVTGYPHTNVKAWEISNYYPLLRRQGKKISKNCVECNFSMFSVDRFLNQNRIKSFFGLEIYDMEVNYQSQPINRFIDYLFGQLISFLMAPHTLHIYDGPRRGPFLFDNYLALTEAEILEIIENSLQPFFNKQIIIAQNLLLHFNSFPYQEAINITVERAEFTSNHMLSEDRVRFKMIELQKTERNPVYRELVKMDEFQSAILKTHWINKMSVTAEGIRSSIFDQQFDYDMVIQRVANPEKGLIFPFVEVDQSLLSEAFVKAMSIRAPKQVYNLINRCIMHNISYDDRKDQHFMHNHKFKDRMTINENFFSIKVAELQVIIPENEAIIAIPKFEFKFIRYPTDTKEMRIEAHSLSILNNDDFVLSPASNDLTLGLEYCIEMKTSGEKVMSAYLKSLEIDYKLKFFLELGKYFVLDQSCYPKALDLSDLPLIICEVHLLNSTIKLGTTATSQYICQGDMKMLWTRNQLMHPDRYAANPSLFPSGKQWCNYKISLRQFNIRRHQLDKIEKGKGYRSLSNQISMAVGISQLMKISGGGQKFNDTLFNVVVNSLGLKLCSNDIEELKTIFMPAKKPEEQERGNMNEGEMVPPPTYHPITKYTFDIARVFIHLGMSELPVPLLDLSIKDTKGTFEMMGKQQSISLKASISVFYWNMPIGRWEPLVQQCCPDVNLKLGDEKLLILDCSDIVLFNLSVDAVQIIKLISNDFKSKGQFSITDQRHERPRGANLSPYILTNHTGVTLEVTNDFVDIRRVATEQKIYLEIKSFQIEKEEEQSFNFRLEGTGKWHKVELGLAIQKKVNVDDRKDHQILIKPISTPIVKEIVVSSLFLIENATSLTTIIYWGDEKIKLSAREKKPMRFNMNRNRMMRLEFPALKKYEVVQNCEFPHSTLLNDYQHCIFFNNKRTFNCILTMKEETETTYKIAPTFLVKNLLPIDILVEFLVSRPNQLGEVDKLTFPNRMEVNEEKPLYDFSTRENIQIRVKIKGFNISSFQSIMDPFSPNEYRNTLDLIDFRGNEGQINFKVMKDGMTRRIYIYSENILINQTKFDWYAFAQSTLLPGQKLQNVPESDTLYTFITKAPVINFGFGEDNAFNSNEVTVSELGVQQVSMFKGTLLYEFTIKNTLHCLDTFGKVYCNVLNAQPKYIFINNTSSELEIIQANFPSKIETLQPGARLNWVWPFKTQPKLIMLRLNENQIDLEEQSWNFTEGLQLTQLEEKVLVLRPYSNTPWKKLIKIVPLRENQSHFFLVEDIKSIEDHLLTCVNELKLCKVRICQQNLKEKNPLWIENRFFEVNPGATVPFGWDFPSLAQMLEIQVSFTGYLRSKFETKTFKASLAHQYSQQLTIANQNDEFQTINIRVEIIGRTKIVTFFKSQDGELEDDDLQMEKERPGNKLALSFCEIGISVITGMKKRAELFYLNLKKIEVLLIEKRNSRSVQVRVKFINIDNNLNHNIIYPILFTPLKQEKTMNKSRPFFVLLLEQTLSKRDVTEIKELRMCMEPISLKIHDEILVAAFEFLEDLNRASQESETKVNLVPIYRSYMKKMEWEEITLAKPTEEIFLREFQIAKIFIEITFSIRPKFNADNFVIMTILSSFGAAISNVSEAQLTLSRFFKKDKGLSQLKKQINDFYIKQVIKGLYKVLGSINLFGNPYVFIKLFAEGAWQIVNQPTEGFIKGPVEGATGIFKGGVYFTRNVIAGTCNSFQAISESISRGVSYMTMDEKFIERREKIKIQKSKHLFKGLQYGGFALYTGFEVAITGLVRHPVDGYHANGMLGGLTGVLKGISGLVTKPISGTFQGISKVSQGIKNTALLFQDGPNSKRLRPPRVFYSQLNYFKGYNYYQSQAIQILEHVSTRYLNSQINFISIIINQEQNLVDAFVLTSKFYSEVDLGSRRITKEIDLLEVKHFWLEQDRMVIETSREQFPVREGNYSELFLAFTKMSESKQVEG